MRAMRLAAIAAALVFSRAQAKELGEGGGSGISADTPPVTKGLGPSEERAELPARDLAVSPRHGMLGAPGAAPDSEGASRLGARASAPAWELLGASDAYGPWRSGDMARSRSSGDVRAARQQQAPDLEWVAAPATSRGTASRAPVATGLSPAPRPGQVSGDERREGMR